MVDVLKSGFSKIDINKNIFIFADLNINICRAYLQIPLVLFYTQ